MKKNKIGIAIVDDHPVIRKSWKLFLERNESFEFRGACGDETEIMDLLRESIPDVLLIDVQMKPVDGFTLTRTIKILYPAIKIIGVSLSNHPSFAENMMEAGASGFITKASPLKEIEKALKEVYAGKTYICKEVKDRMK